MDNDASKTQSLIVVMPVYNEAGCIKQVLDEWLAILRKVDGVLLVINDGSTDGTQAVLETVKNAEPRLHIITQSNGGHGAAILRGYREAIALGPKYIFQTDSDDQIKAESFMSLWNARNRSPFIVAIRHHRQDGRLRLTISKISKIINALLFGATIQDANVPFRLMKKTLLAELLAELPKAVFAPNIFLSILAVKRGIQIEEIPVWHKARTTGKESIRRLKLLKACATSAQELIAFRMTFWRTRNKVTNQS